MPAVFRTSAPHLPLQFPKKIHLPHPASVLVDSEIRSAMAAHKIRVTPRPADIQFQPASLDVRIGAVNVFPGDGSCKSYSGPPGTEIPIPPRARAEILLAEKIALRDHQLSFELKSKLGRLFLRAEGALQRTPGGWEIASRNWNINELVVKIGQPFGQVLFHPFESAKESGIIATEEDQLNKILRKYPESGLVQEGPFVKFTVGERAWEFRAGLSLSVTNLPDPNLLYEKHDLTHGPLTVAPFTPIIVSLDPPVQLPAQIGVMLTQRIPSIHPSGHTKPIVYGTPGQNVQANAGWLDPGFHGAPTAHLQSTLGPLVISKGSRTVYGILYHFPKGVNRPYGTPALQSSYMKYSGGVAR